MFCGRVQWWRAWRVGRVGRGRVCGVCRRAGEWPIRFRGVCEAVVEECVRHTVGAGSGPAGVGPGRGAWWAAPAGVVAPRRARVRGRCGRLCGVQRVGSSGENSPPNV